MVVTRATEQAHELAHSLEALGADVLLLPTVSFAAVEDSQSLDAALRGLAEFDWILFTSQNAVRFFCPEVTAPTIVCQMLCGKLERRWLRS